MKTSIEILMSKLEVLYENIFALLKAQNLAASNTTSADIPVTLKNFDGTSYIVNVNSFQKIQQELARIDNNFKSLTNENNVSYILNAEGSLEQYSKTSFMTAEVLENFSFDNVAVVDKISIVNDLIYPNVKLPITIDSTIKTNILCKILEVTAGWDLIPENPSLLNMQYLKDNGKIVYKEINRDLTLAKEQITYFGKFNIESIVFDASNSNKCTCVLDNIQYQSINSIGNSIDLKIGDFMVSKTGASKYQIATVDKLLKKIEIVRIAGSEVLSVGTEKIYFNQTLSNPESNIVNVPIRPSQQIVIFLSTENLKAISFPSVGIKIDTTDYKVIYEGTTYTLDEFFSEFVTNFSEYLTALMSETSIPYSLGIKPETPTIESKNFRVIQINKHLTDAKTTDEIQALNKKKQSIQDTIDYKETQIGNIQNTIDSQKYQNSVEKQTLSKNIISLRQEINVLKTNLLTVSRDIDNNAIIAGIKDAVLKYKLIGFWPIQSPIYSAATQLQHIIKYDVQYRYLSKDNDKTESTTYTMVSNGKESTVTFSNWVDLTTKTLSKITDDNGNVVWETPVLDSADDININQCAITISEGESLEVRIRAVSEAGYPIAPMKSEWSNILRYDFPTDLKNASITSTVAQNTSDLQNALFNDILNKNGILSHVQNSIKDGDKTFLHPASDVSSGQYTTEQKNIPLDTMIQTLINRIATLENNKTSNKVEVSVVDFNNESYVISNNSTIDLFAGNYTDVVPVLDNTKWGGIVRKKGYIKIRNNNTTPVELKTLVPGIQDNIKFPESAPKYYNVPIKNVDKILQETRQILYFRNVDLSDQINVDAYKLIVDALADVTTIPTDIDPNVILESEKDLLYLDSTDLENATIDDIKTCKLTTQYTSNFVAFAKTHPLYISNDLTGLLAEFKRITKYTQTLKTKQVQTAITDVDGLTGIVGYNDNDTYCVGATSCGAFLYPVIPSKQAISVNGFTTVATLIIPATSEILIPFIFEYRMIDKFGNVDGIQTTSPNNTLEYSKKIGIDILINNEIFKFDINCYSRLKAKINGIDNKSVQSLLASFNNENQSNLI